MSYELKSKKKKRRFYHERTQSAQRRDWNADDAERTDKDG